MSSLPERYQRYAQPGQPSVRYGDVELHDERDPVAWVPDAYGEMVPMRRSQLPAFTPPPVRDLTPQPLLDPQAQRLLAGGVGVGAAGAGLGFGMGQMFAGVALMGTSGLALLVGLIVAAGSMRGARTTVRIHNEAHTHVEQKWFGRTDVTNLQ